MIWEQNGDEDVQESVIWVQRWRWRVQGKTEHSITVSQGHDNKTALCGYTRVASHNMGEEKNTKRTMLWLLCQWLEKQKTCSHPCSAVLELRVRQGSSTVHWSCPTCQVVGALVVGLQKNQLLVGTHLAHGHTILLGWFLGHFRRLTSPTRLS